MPRGNPNFGKQFGAKPGEHRNQSGVKPLSAEARDLKLLTAENHIKIVSDLLQKTPTQIREIMKNPYTNCHTLMVAALIKKAIVMADSTVYRELMDRMIGKVTQPIGGDDTKPPLRIRIEDARTRPAGPAS